MARRAPVETDALARFSLATRTWFEETFERPTDAQRKAWPAIQDGASTLLLAPTGSGKTLAAFLAAIDRAITSEEPPKAERCKILYVSPLKALAVDVERNLRAPLAGITKTAERLGVPCRALEVAMRTGDTPASERARIQRRPPDLLITTPESLYLMLTSGARELLRSVDTVIVDEIHAVAPTKRGAHLFLSLERLEALRPEGARSLQRIGLSATQRPIEEVARLLGGMMRVGEQFVPRPVRVADARAEKNIELSIEVPVDDMASLGASDRPGAIRGDSNEGAPPRSIWTSIHPRLVELVRAHRSTMIFVNNRRLAERLAAALNETAGEDIARAHHGSVAREERVQIEDALKSGRLPCIVATSSLELGLDLGAVDLVVQIEAPPSVASGIQRVGRASHHVGGTPRGTIFPKHRADLVAAAEAARRMRAGEIEETRHLRNPLDVLAQQIAAIVSTEGSISVPALHALVRSAAPFAELTRNLLDGVLDMLSGRYPSDEFAELRPRVTWDRETNTLTPRKGTQRLAIVNGGVIPDRGLYGVFLDGGNEKTSKRVGELDEEMVFEAREGEIFVLGATSWKITNITQDRVMVVPVPGEPGKMPFWRGDRVGRSVALGKGIGALLRFVERSKDAAATERLVEDHFLDARAAANLVRYVRDQSEAPYRVPTDRQIVIERFRDEIGDYRVCILSPFGARVHAPLSACLVTKAREQLGVVLESVWSDDGLVLRFPDDDEPPDVAALFPSADEVEELLVRSLGETALFASHFRECAQRALLLPRRTPGKRSPLWAQRKRASDLLAVASRFPSFPMLLETYRECLEDVFDVPALVELMRDVSRGALALTSVDAERASPFSTSLLFGYVGNFVYDADAPLAERRAQALSIDHAQLKELLGQAELRELLDEEAMVEVEAWAQRRERTIDDPDELHDLLLLLGDQTEGELDLRLGVRRAELLDPLVHARRVIPIRIAGEKRFAAVEDAARYRDAVGAMPPPGLADAFLAPVADPLLDLVSRWARTHGPFVPSEIAARLGASEEAVVRALETLLSRGRVVRGEIDPRRRGVDWCDAEILRAIKRRSLAALRREAEPVSHEAYARYLLRWHGVDRPRRGEGALAAALEKLEGAPIPVAALERDVLPARVAGYLPGDLDALLSSGELVWRGIEASAAGGGRIALYFRSNLELLAPRVTPAEGPLVEKVRAALAARGAVFFHDLVRTVGAFPPDVLDALWVLVWSGEATNDTLLPLRSRMRGDDKRSRPGATRGGARVLPGSEGRWSLLVPASEPTETERRTALVRTLLTRHGVLVREALAAEGIPGGFSSVYDVLRAMEDAGRVRRGYFVEGLGAAQFALPGADEPLRAEREPRKDARPMLVAATDPANAWGAALAWPKRETGARPQRADGALVVLGADGRLLAWLGRAERSMLTFVREDPRERGEDAEVIARTLAEPVDRGARAAMLIAQVDGAPAETSVLGEALRRAGFAATSRGMLKRGARRPAETVVAMDDELELDADI
jgi:ATP-dependent Lhr-like helicase